MKTSFEKFMASSAVQSIKPVKVEMGEIKVELALEDIDALVTRYFQITDNAQGQSKGILGSLRQVLSVYENALNQESPMQKSKVVIEKMAADFKAMGVTVNPNEWEEYRILLRALKDIDTMKAQAESIRKAISLLS
jgi:hypothetical protein